MKVHLEYQDEKSSKFWEVEVAGSEVTVRYGRIGATGQTKTKDHSSPAAAQKDAEKQIAAKKKKGYVETKAGGTAGKATNAKKKTMATRTPSVASPAPKKKVAKARSSKQPKQKIKIKTTAELKPVKGADAFLDAVLNKKQETVAKLLAKNPDLIEAVNKNKSTALMVAAFIGAEDIVSILLDNGADPNIWRKEGYSALRFAIQEGHEKVAIQLCKGGADIDTTPPKVDSPILSSVEKGMKSLVRVLAECGADVNAPGFMGKTPLLKAAFEGKLEIAKILLKHGADPSIADNSKDRPLYVASNMNRFTVVKCLLENGASVDERNKEGSTPLMIAAFCGHNKILTVLLEHGADINAQDKFGETALMFAAGQSKLNTVQVLLDAGVDISIKDKYLNSAVIHAMDNWDGSTKKVVQALLNAGADPNDQRKGKEESVLIWAASNGYADIVELALKKGANVKLKTYNGKTAISEAKSKVVVELLSKQGGNKAAQKPTKEAKERTCPTKAEQKKYLTHPKTESAEQALKRLSKYVTKHGSPGFNAVPFGKKVKKSEIAKVEKQLAERFTILGITADVNLPKPYVDFVTKHGPLQLSLDSDYAIFAPDDAYRVTEREIDTLPEADRKFANSVFIFQAQRDGCDFFGFDMSRRCDGDASVEVLYHDDSFVPRKKFTHFNQHFSAIVDEIIKNDLDAWQDE